MLVSAGHIAAIGDAALPRLHRDVPARLLDGADLRIRIPMTGTAESLNVAVAAGIMLYEVRRHAVSS